MHPSEVFNHYEPVPESGCWLWTRSMITHGYGNFGYKQKQYRAHRIAYEEAYGPIPEGLHVLHKCDVRLCINPAHLFLGTNKDNIDDRVKKGRSRDCRGEKAPKSKLKRDDVLTILRLHAAGMSIKAIARKYGVTSNGCISPIINKINWVHIWPQ